MQKMTKNLNKELKQYYHEIDKILSCNNRKKKNILESIKTSVECYLSENPDSSIDDVIERFGSPKEIADEYYYSEGSEAISAKMKKSKKILICVIATLCLALLIYIAVVISALIHDMNATDGDFNSLTIEEISPTDL